MKMTGKILNNEEKPEKKIGRPRKYEFQWDTIEIGQGFDAGEYSAKLLANVSNQANYYAGKSGKKFSCQKIDGRLTVWRVKDDGGEDQLEK